MSPGGQVMVQTSQPCRLMTGGKQEGIEVQFDRVNGDKAVRSPREWLPPASSQQQRICGDPILARELENLLRCCVLAGIELLALDRHRNGLAKSSEYFANQRGLHRRRS